MRAVIVTSSVLIVALLLLRLPFRRAISRRMQYALWLVVLVRLLLPVSFSSASFSVLSLAEQTQTRLSNYTETVRSPVTVTQPDSNTQAPDTNTITSPTATPVPEQDTSITLPLFAIWLTVACLCGLCFLLSNLRFARQLRQERIPYLEANCPLPVYLCQTLPSPCLFGLLRPAIYVNPTAMQSESSLRHVLAHEESHYRQGDHIWSVLRALCLCVYWFNPLVWVAAYLSKNDCELACDELALQRLDETDRLPYGHTLLALIPLRGQGGNPLLTATTMQGSKRQLRKRISCIANKRQPVALAVFVALVLVGLLCVASFMGGSFTGYASYQPVGSFDRTLSLETIPFYTPPKLNIVHGTGDEITYMHENHFTLRAGEKKLSVFLYRTADGTLNAGYQEVDAPSQDFYQFASFPNGLRGNFSLSSGYLLDYEDSSVLQLWVESKDDTQSSEYTTYFYHFNKQGEPEAIFSIPDFPYPLTDSERQAPGLFLKSQGQKEAILWYSYENHIRRLDVSKLVQEAYPEWNDIFIAPIQSAIAERGLNLDDINSRSDFSQSDVYIPVQGYVEQRLPNGDTTMVLARRYLYLHENSADFYREANTVDHMSRGVYAEAELIEAAQDLVQEYFLAAQAAYPDMQFIDWRIRSLDPVPEILNYEVGQGLLSVSQLSYEFLSASPENFIPLGGSYLTEDHWCMPGYPASDYLVSHSTFDVETQTHHKQYLDHIWTNDLGPGSEEFSNTLAEIAEQALADGRIPPLVFDPETGEEVQTS